MSEIIKVNTGVITRVTNRRRGRVQKGFTLVELLVVISIIGILASVTLSYLDTAREQANDSARIQDMGQVKNALELYASKHSGNYPDLSVAFNNQIKPVWLPQLSFFTSLFNDLSLFNTVHAAGHTDPACQKFDTLANALVSDGDLSAVPADPHDASTVTCYKAWMSYEKDVLSAYTYLSKKYKNITVGSSEAANKQVGIIVSKQTEVDRALIGAVCTGTRQAYGDSYAFPVINPHEDSSLCDTSSMDNLVADNILGVTSGDETIVTDQVSSGGSCSNSNHNSSQQDCETDHSYCSNLSYSDQSSCENAGDYQYACSDSSYTDESSCENAGYATGYCSDSVYGDQSSCENATVTTSGYCSGGSYSDQASCEGAGSGGGGYCTGGGYPDQSSCENAGYTGDGYCSNNTYYNQSDCENAGYGSDAYCSDGGYYDQGSCESAAGTWYSSVWTSYGYTWTPGTFTSYGYSWVGQEFTSYGYTWTSGNTVSEGNTWYSSGWTSYGYTWNSTSYTPYTWTSDPAGTWTAN